MSKFYVTIDMGGPSLHVDTAQTNLEIGATQNELIELQAEISRRLYERNKEEP